MCHCTKWIIRYEHKDIREWIIPEQKMFSCFQFKICHFFPSTVPSPWSWGYNRLESEDNQLQESSIYFSKFSVLISFTSSPQECGYNFMYQSASNSLWRLKRRTWIWLIHIKVCTSKMLFYILKISWGNWSILCVTNTNYHTKLTNAMVMYFSLTLVPLLNITIRIGVT